MKRTVLITLAIVGGVSVFYFGFTLVGGDAPGESLPPIAHPAAAPAETITRASFAAVTPEILDKVIAYSKTKDFVAIDKLVQSGQVISLQKGTPVDVIERAQLGSIIKVHQRGETNDFWTIMEAVQ